MTDRKIRRWWESEDDVTFICRPRRFGKTLTLDMTPLEAFAGFTEEETAALYQKYDMDFYGLKEKVITMLGGGRCADPADPSGLPEL